METQNPILIGFQNSLYELKEYKITERQRLAWYKGFKEIGVIVCPFCGKRVIIEIKSFNNCAPVCSGRIINAGNTFLDCRAKFYPGPLFPNDLRLFARAGMKYINPIK